MEPISSREGFNTGDWITIAKRTGEGSPDLGLQESATAGVCAHWPQHFPLSHCIVAGLYTAPTAGAWAVGFS